MSSSEADGTTEEGGGKGGTIHPRGVGGFEIILTLLIKMVVIHVGFSGVGFQNPSLKWALPWLSLVPSLDYLYKHLHEFGEEILGGRRNKRWSRSLGRSKSFIATGIELSALGASKFILLCRVNKKIDTRAPLDNARSWSHCKGWRSKRDSSKCAG